MESEASYNEQGCWAQEERILISQVDLHEEEIQISTRKTR